MLTGGALLRHHAAAVEIRKKLAAALLLPLAPDDLEAVDRAWKQAARRCADLTVARLGF